MGAPKSSRKEPPASIRRGTGGSAIRSQAGQDSKRRPSKKRKCISRSRARQAKLQIEVRSTRASSASPSRVACAIESTSAQSPRSLALFVGAAPRIPIIFVLPKAALYPAR